MASLEEARTTRETLNETSRHQHAATALLLAWGDGDPGALNELVPLVHDELRQLARRHMAASAPAIHFRRPRSSTRRTSG